MVMYIKVMYYLFFFFLSFVMTTLNIGSFNVNGCRCTRKRVALFDYLRLKQADVILLQETHTDQQNQAQWYGDWKGSVVLSHGTNLSAGVAILFSPHVSIQPDVVEIIPGRILRVDMVFGNTNFSFINVYAPNVGQESISFFKTLSDALLQCTQGNVVVLGGDFNCTVNSYLDRNHDQVQVQVQVELYCHSAACGDIQWNEMSCLTGPRCYINTDIQQ